MRRLLPKARDFFFELDSHVARIVDASALLLEMTTQASADLAHCAQRIKTLEHECDTITHKLILELHKSFVTPLDRLGTHEIISRLDDVMDAVEQAAYVLARAGLRATDVDSRAHPSGPPTQPRSAPSRPGSVPLEAVRLVEIVVSSIDLIARGVHGLKRIGTGDELLGICQGLSKLERQADESSREAIDRLFRDVRDAASLLNWKELYEGLEQITDRCADVGNVLENVVLDLA